MSLRHASEFSAPRRASQAPQARDWALLAAWGMAVVFAVVAAVSVRGLNPYADEMTDLHITYELILHPLIGNHMDGSQARLPMMLSAPAIVAVELIKPSSNWITHTYMARGVAIAVNALAIVLTFVLARRWFNSATGLLAAGLLTISPYFLDLGRMAMTEGDAFCPLAMLLVLLAFERFERQRTRQAIAWLGLALGVAICTKFLLGVMIVALAAFELIRIGQQAKLDSAKWRTAWRGRLDWPGLVVCGLLGVLALVGLGIVQATKRPSHPVADACWAVCLAGLGLIVAMLIFREVRRRRNDVRPPASSEENLAWPAAWLCVFALAGTVSLTLVPAHMLQPAIFVELTHRADTWDDQEVGSQAGIGIGGVSTGDPQEAPPSALNLYGGIVLFKLGVPLGVLTIASFVWAAVAGLRGHRHLLLLAWVSVVWMVMLFMLPLLQPFYPMAIYPLGIIMLAAAIAQLARTLRDRSALLWTWRAITATAIGFLLVGTIRSYPTFNYYGYETFGDHWLGVPTRGARSLVRVSNDGSLDAFEWISQKLPPDATVLSLAWDKKTLTRMGDDAPKQTIETAGKAPYEAYRHQLNEADALLVTLQNRTRFMNAPPDEEIAELFGPPAHVIYRGRGVYRMPVAEIYLAK